MSDASTGESTGEPRGRRETLEVSSAVISKYLYADYAEVVVALGDRDGDRLYDMVELHLVNESGVSMYVLLSDREIDNLIHALNRAKSIAKTGDGGDGGLA